MTKLNNTLKVSKDLPLITDLEASSILDSLILGKTSIEIAKDLQIPLTKLYKVLDQDANFKEKFGHAQEIGMRTLIEKMLILFDNKPQQIRSDQNINISFSSGMDDREVLDLDPKQFEVTQDLNSTNKETD